MAMLFFDMGRRDAGFSIARCWMLVQLVVLPE
jgi:hypothetical protein